MQCVVVRWESLMILFLSVSAQSGELCEWDVLLLELSGNSAFHLEYLVVICNFIFKWLFGNSDNVFLADVMWKLQCIYSPNVIPFPVDYLWIYESLYGCFQ